MTDNTGTPANNKDPLHGVKLEQILTELVEEHTWAGLAELVPINCFKSNPSIKSSLKFLRKTPWARQKVESLYLRLKGYSAKKRATKTPRALEGERLQSSGSHRSGSSLGRGRDEMRERKDTNRSNRPGAGRTSSSAQQRGSGTVNPWANAKLPNNPD
ncbi:VF530 family protein [Oceanospirillum beijerinckii]|uniref:VF530 family protein n=1 Tax=Oceanospirillum beijerinckii TaxID=64976 RepID=UPI0004116BEB